MEQSFSGKATSFNGAAETYDKMRPGYVPELYREIFRYRPVTTQSKVLEIGVGTGQATRPILETGCTLTAVEPGDKLAHTCEEKFRAYPNFSVENTTFEAFSPPEGSFDLIFAATSFHWVLTEVGYPKVLRLFEARRGLCPFCQPAPAPARPPQRRHPGPLQYLYAPRRVPKAL